VINIKNSLHLFPELKEFVENSKKRYNFTVIDLNGDYKTALASLKSTNPKIQAIFMGTRNTDPKSSSLEPMQKTDADWPEFDRIFPLLQWNYGDIWRFLRGLSLPYCSLYDKGYTSIGDILQTKPNPALEFLDPLGIVRHKPAFLLENFGLERVARGKSHY